MSVLIKDMEMPKECHGCRWFYFQGTSCTEPKYYLDARCELVESGQDWYGKDRRGGWVGESIEHIPGWTGSYAYKHCTEVGTRAKQCPLCELPSAQPKSYREGYQAGFNDAQSERKRGKWEMLQMPISPPVYKCSVCGSHALQSMTGCLMNRHYEANLTNYCPNCGADMREVSE